MWSSRSSSATSVAVVRASASASTGAGRRTRKSLHNGSVVADREQQRRPARGSNQLPRRCPHHLPRRRRGRALGEEHLDRLARQAMRPSSGISSPFRPAGVAAAVPVLVERAHRVGGRRRGSRASRRSPRRGRSARRRSPCPRRPGRPQRRRDAVRAAACDSPGATFARGVAQRLGRARPVDGLAARLSATVVGAEERRHPSGVARAADVLQQQRVEEGGGCRPRPGAGARRGACRSGTCARRARRAAPRSGRARARAQR